MSKDSKEEHAPKLRISTVKLDDVDDHTPSSDQLTPNHRNMSAVITPTENENDAAAVSAADADSDESYKTPTSKESKIPEILTCPPAPQKPKPLVSCKRKLLDEFQFFEVTSNEDMDAFFRSTFPKRSCLVHDHNSTFGNLELKLRKLLHDFSSSDLVTVGGGGKDGEEDKIRVFSEI